jgi:aminobenzoyl-glutamate utilization protein B
MALELKEEVTEYIDNKKDWLINVSRTIWEYAEVALNEHRSSKLLADVLEREGFKVQIGVAGLPTAFVASWGNGRPTIGYLAEYDALPGLSTVKEGSPGHGCGHNLLGTSFVAAAIATRNTMQKHNVKGEIRVYGCPAEETLYGKVVMAAKGLFDDLDVALQWHPGDKTTSAYDSFNGLDNKTYRFYGKAAHAGSIPWEGKSALDAAQLLNLGIEFMREHMRQTERIHYVIKSGGEAPNIVPDYSEVWVFVRSPDMNRLMELSRRVDLCSIAASLATGTTCKIERNIGCYLILPNKTLSLIVDENLKMLGSIKLTDDEREFVRTQLSKVYEKFPEEILPTKGWEIGEDWIGETGSTDVGDVSWIVPTNGTLWIGTFPSGAAFHSLDTAKMSNTSIGYKGMILAAKTLACTTVDLLNKPEIIKESWNEFKKRKEVLGEDYKPLTPAKLEYPEYSGEAMIIPKNQ